MGGEKAELASGGDQDVVGRRRHAGAPGDAVGHGGAQRGDAGDAGIAGRTGGGAGLHRGEDGRLGVEAGADDKRKTEAGEIGGVEPLKFGELGLGQTIEPGAGLFTGGLGGERVLPGETTGEIGVRADELKLARAPGGAHRGAQFGVQVRRIAKRPARPRLLLDPRRVFEKVPERGGEGRPIEGVERGKREHQREEPRR